MANLNRRQILQVGTAGAGAWLLGSGIGPTAASGTLGAYAAEVAVLDARSAALAVPPAALPEGGRATEDNILGPFYRANAPFRAKITPPLEPGEPLVVRGRVWGVDSRKPLTSAVLDVWQANAKGRYDNDDAANQPAENVFVHRARIAVDETGYYEYETIKPGRYQIGEDRWRPSHIHYLVRAPGYKPLVTQLYFKGDPMNDKDDFIKASLIMDPKIVKVDGGSFLLGTFDIVLNKA
jgi:catechol 1,2-dioxygenase